MSNTSKFLVWPLLTIVFISSCNDEDNGVPASLNLPKFTVSDLSIDEADVNQEITIEMSLNGTNTTNAIVNFATIPGTADATDYEVLTKSPIIFQEGESSKNIVIKINGDEAKELKESFQIKFYNPKNVSLVNDLITVSINDDDDNTEGLLIPTEGFNSPLTYTGYTLAWADEFDGETLNSSNWTHELGDGCPGNCGWGNNELQFYREDNTTLSNGNLIITAKKQNFGNKEYTSSRIVTKAKKFFKFGRIDIRAALPKGKGMWPALWMLGTNIDAVSWPSCGEIDIMELTGDIPNRVVGTVHYGSSLANHQYKSNSKYLSNNENYQDKFHVFSLNWAVDKIEFLVDDEVYHTIIPSNLGGQPYPFNKNFFFVFNVAVGGSFPGNPDGSTPFPQSMIVDYVRVFNKG